MLEAGGNAVDAAVAAAFALSAAEPGGSGIGGQSWMVLRMATGEARAIYCPPLMPMRIDRARMTAYRKGHDLWGPMAASVPTTVATLAHALRRYGTKSFAEVLAPSVAVAESGYRFRSFERGYLANYVHRVRDSAILAPIYLVTPTGNAVSPEAIPADTCVKIPSLADTLRRLAEAGSADFYSGTIAAQLDDEMRAAGGFVTRADLARVPGSVLDVEPVRGRYRGLSVLSAPSPAGGETFVAALQILGALPEGTLAQPGLARGHAIVEAVRLAFTRSAQGAVDRKWLTASWAKRQARRIHPERALTYVEMKESVRSNPGNRGTSHISVVDSRGNAVSLTQSLGRYFGAAWAPPGLGFLLNAFLEPLDLIEAAGTRSGVGSTVDDEISVAPIILVRDGRVFLVAGTGGSTRIPSILLNVVTSLVDGHEPAADAVAQPRMLWEIGSAGPRVLLEVAGPWTLETVEVLKTMGHDNVFALTTPGSNSGAFGGVYTVTWNAAASTWEGVADNRRAGIAAAPAHIVTIAP